MEHTPTFPNESVVADHVAAALGAVHSKFTALEHERNFFKRERDSYNTRCLDAVATLDFLLMVSNTAHVSDVASRIDWEGTKGALEAGVNTMSEVDREAVRHRSEDLQTAFEVSIFAATNARRYRAHGSPLTPNKRFFDAEAVRIPPTRSDIDFCAHLSQLLLKLERNAQAACAAPISVQQIIDVFEGRQDPEQLAMCSDFVADKISPIMQCAAEIANWHNEAVGPEPRKKFLSILEAMQTLRLSKNEDGIMGEREAGVAGGDVRHTDKVEFDLDGEVAHGSESSAYETCPETSSF